MSEPLKWPKSPDGVLELSKEALSKLLSEPGNKYMVKGDYITITYLASGVSFKYVHQPSTDTYALVNAVYNSGDFTPVGYGLPIVAQDYGNPKPYNELYEQYYNDWQTQTMQYEKALYAPGYGSLALCQCIDCKKAQASVSGLYAGAGYAINPAQYFYPKQSKDYIDGRTVVRGLAKLFPNAVNTYFSICPLLARGEKCTYGETWRTNKVNLLDVVVHLNDKHHKTREEIADWLESLDVNLAAEVPENPEDEKDTYNV